MKKVLLSGLLLSLLFITTGCIKCSYTIEIDKKNNVLVSETEALNTKMLKSFDPNIETSLKQEFDKQSGEYSSKGYKVEDYNDGTFMGVTLSKNYKIKDMNNSDLPEGFTSNNDKPIVHRPGFFKDTYEIGLRFNPQEGFEKSKNAVSGQAPNDDFSKAMTSMLSNAPGLAPEFTLVIKIPYKAVDTNATEVISDTEYKWVIPPNGSANIVVYYEKYNAANIIFTILLIIVLFILGVKYNNYINNSNW